MKRFLKSWLSSFNTLRWRLTFYYAGLVCVLVGGLGLFTYNQVVNFAEDTVRHQLLNYPVPPIPAPPQPPTRPDPNRLLQEYSNLVAQQSARDTTVNTWVLDWNGNPVTSNISTTQDQAFTSSLEGIVFPPSARNLEQARAGGSYYNIEFPEKFFGGTSGEPVTALAYLSVAPGSAGRPLAQPVYVLRIKPLTEIRPILNQIRTLLISGLLVVVLLALLLGLPLAKFGLRPINKVTTIVRQTRSGDLSKRVELSKQASNAASNDEVWQMAYEFNMMLDQLEASFTAQKESESRTRQFVADASHELRSPLTILRGYLDVLAMGAQDNPPKAEHITNAMRSEITRLSRMVVDLLTLTRLDQDGQASLQLGPVVLADLLWRAQDNFKVLANGRRLELRVAPEVANLTIQADADRLYQVVSNLLDNAIRYTAQDGQITIIFRKSEPSSANNNATLDNRLLLSITDNGCGIQAEHLTHIFDRFFRSDRSRSRSTGNWGLGLAISKSIVEAHRGTISVQSVTDKGTTFSIFLPLDK